MILASRLIYLTAALSRARFSMAAVSGAAGLTTDDQTNAAARRAKGEFVRGVSAARSWIGTDANYPAVAGRYHLYVAYNCPWCHRVLLGRSVLGLEDVISVSVLFPSRTDDDDPRGPNLWKFNPKGRTMKNGAFVDFDECTEDTVLGKEYAIDIYAHAGLEQKSVPILFDKETQTVVNNESAEILRMMGTVLAPLGTRSRNLYPSQHQTKIDELNDWVYTEIANGSYKAGFSSNQEVYETAYDKFFAALEKLNAMLADSQFLVGDELTEADLRLFPPLFRLDPVYYSRFRLNQAFLWQYPHIWRWMGNVMRMEGMEPVSNASYLQHCKQGYFGRTGVGTVPLGPKGYPECYLQAGWKPE